MENATQGSPKEYNLKQLSKENAQLREQCESLQELNDSVYVILEETQERALGLEEQLAEAQDEQGQLQYVIDLHSREIVYLIGKLKEAQGRWSAWKDIGIKLADTIEDMDKVIGEQLRRIEELEGHLGHIEKYADDKSAYPVETLEGIRRITRDALQRKKDAS